MIRNLIGNRIAHVSGLSNLPALEILHLDHQRIEGTMTFEIACMEALGASLQTLSMSQCKLKLIEPLSVLFELRDLNMVQNDIDDVEVCLEIFF